MAKQRKMVSMEIDETSAVDHPAHKAEGWLVVKSADQSSLIDALEELVSEPEEEIVSEEVETEVEKKMHTDLDKANAYIAELEKKMAEMKMSYKKSEDAPEDLMKSADPVIQEMFAKAQAETESLRKALDAEREEKVVKEYIAKAEKWTNLNAQASEVGPMLRKMAALDENIANELEKLLDAANAQAESAGMFAELGTTKSLNGASALERVQSLAKAAVVAGEYKTVEQAVSGLIQQSPSLYAEYLAETR